jgi:hypothetical protein
MEKQQLSATTPDRVQKIQGLNAEQTVNKDISVEDDTTLTDITSL